MKKLWILLLVACFWACNDDENGRIFADLSSEAFSFKPMAGGAVMHYILPDDPDVVGIYVRYQNAEGLDILRAGSCTSDSLLLTGFNEAKTNVPAQVSLCYVGDRESQPIDVMFSTEDSAPVAFLKNVEVSSNWGGFSLSFDNPDNATGMAHVFYLGIDPSTGKQDTIWLESFLLQETDGLETLNYEIQQDVVDPMVIVRSEDFRGVMVGERTWEKVPTLVKTKLDPSNFTFYCDNSIENDYDKLGVQYLFDGDLKGELNWGTDGRCYSFLAGPDAAGENAHPMYMDMGENRVTASIRLYDMYDCYDDGPSWRQWNGWTGHDYQVASVVYMYRMNEAPCEVTLYGLKDDGGAPKTYEDMATLEGWVEIGTFKQDKALEKTQRWQSSSCKFTGFGKKKDEIQAADPVYLEVLVPAIGQGEGYRYLKMVINEVFDLTSTMGRDYENTYKYVQFHELEIYTDKD